MTLLSVVIVNYRSAAYLNACVDALFVHNKSCSFEILVVNNDRVSDLSSLPTLNRSEVRTIQNSSNIGFGAAANIGFDKSNGEFVLLLNPDILVRPEAVASLLQAIQSHPDAGLVLPQLRNPDDSLQYSCRRFYTWKTLWMRRGPWRRHLASHPTARQHLMQEWDHASAAEVDWGLGAAMLVRKHALCGERLFDERFFLYFEDVDLCLRLHRAGWKVLYNPASVMTHQHRRDSARTMALLAKWHHLCSLTKFLWKYRFRLDPDL